VLHFCHTAAIMQQWSISVKKLTVKKLTGPGIVKILTMIVVTYLQHYTHRTKQEQKNSQLVRIFFWLPPTIAAGHLTTKQLKELKK